jgi:hypothetical protein
MEAWLMREAAAKAHAQHLQDVVRLLQVKPEVAAEARVAESLLCIPKVPHQAAVQLVSAGVRITYAQLLTAANSMVAGVEVWVQVQQQLGAKTDIPPTAVAICCCDCTVFNHWVSCVAALLV